MKNFNKRGQAGLVAWLIIVKSSDQLLTQLATSFEKGKGVRLIV
jgi:hypothetical protein